MLLSRAGSYRYLAKIIVVEVTSTVRGIPQEVVLGAAEGLTMSCVANLDNLHVVRKSCLYQRIGRLATVREIEVKRALGYALGWIELI